MQFTDQIQIYWKIFTLHGLWNFPQASVIILQINWKSYHRRLSLYAGHIDSHKETFSII